MSRFGDLLAGKTAATVPEPVLESVSAPTPPVESTRPDLGEDTINHEKVIEEELSYESDVSFHDMSKKELEEYGRTVGIELDRRYSQKRLVKELTEYLESN